MLSGYTFPYGYNQFYLVKTDKDGNEIWSKISEEISHEDYLQYVAERTSDGGYIVGDMVEYEIPEYSKFELLIDTDIRLAKYIINGSQEWNNTFGKKISSEMVDSWSRPARQTSDGGYIIAGTIHVNETDVYDIWLIKTDKYGQEQWNKTFGGPMDDSAFSISVTSDNGYVLTGMYNGSWAFGIDNSAFILKTDSDGNKAWLKELPNCTLYSVQQTSDGGYIAAGVKNNDAWLVKLAGNRVDNEKMDNENKESPIKENNMLDNVFSQALNYIYAIFQRN